MASNSTHLAGSASLLRAINERAVLGHLMERDSLTRGELVRLTGLSKPTASQALNRLESAGFVSPIGETSGGPGRNATIYAIRPEIVLAAAVEVRPRSLTAAICDLRGQIRAEVRRPIPPRTSAPDAVLSVLEAASERATIPIEDLDLVQLAVPGSYDPMTDTFRYATHVPGWSRPGIVRALRDRLHAGKITVDNDVNLAAVAERTRGVAGDSDGFALLWVSTGLGLAIDLGGEQLRGARGGAGEIGYMPVLFPAGTSGDRRNEFQEVAGAPAVRRLAREHGIRTRSAETAVRRAAQAGARGRPFLRELAERIAVGLASTIAVLDPPLVVLAGDICRGGGPQLRDLVSRAVRRSSRFDTPIEVTGVTGNPVLLGALDSAVRAAREELIGPPADGGSAPNLERDQA